MTFAIVVLFSKFFCYHASAQQFTAGRLVVQRVGDGSPQTDAGTPMFLDEYSTTGIAGITLALPTANAGSVNRTVGSGIATSDGMLTRSADGKWLVVAGYDASPGALSVASTPNNKVVTRVDGSGGMSSTVVFDASAFPGNNFRSVTTTDGSEYWLSGAGNGAVYVPHQGNTTPVAGTEVSNTITDNRGILVYNSVLYQSTAIGPVTGIYNVGAGLPTTPGNMMNVDGNMGVSGDPQSFVVLFNGYPVMYVADFANKVVRKYFQLGSIWYPAGSQIVTVGGVATGFYGITGYVTGGTVRLYATTSNGVGSNSRIVTFTDGTTASTVIIGSVAATTIVGPTFNTAFRGITFAPFGVTGISSASPSVCTGLGTTITISGNPNTIVTYQKNGVPQLPIIIPAGGTYSFSTGTLSSSATYTVVSATDGGITQNYSLNVTVNVNSLPIVTSSGAAAVCNGQSTVLNSGGATSYSWAPATGLSSTVGGSVTATPSLTTTYTVTGTDGNGCVSRSTLTVTVNPLPIISTGTAVAICEGSSTGLAASGGISYTWAPSIGLSATTGSYVIANPTSTTAYTITGTGGNGCINKIVNTVTVNALPVVTSSPGVVMCQGASTIMSASGASTYFWQPSAGMSVIVGSSVTAAPSTSTVYTVSGTDGNGCVGRATVAVTINPLPVISAGPTVSICNGFSAALTATGATDYTWTPGTGLSTTLGSNVTAAPTTTTTYTMTGTDGNGCVNKGTITVIVNPIPYVTGTGAGICPGTTAAISASGTPTIYHWSPGTGLSSTMGTVVIASPPSTTTYTITGTSTHGCVNHAMVTVTVYPLPPVTAGPDIAICNGSSATLTATGAATYSWAPGYGLSATAGNVVTAHPATTTTYTITGIYLCVNRATITVSVNPLPSVVVPGATMCMGSPTVLTATGATSYSWLPATGLSAVVGSSVTANPTANTIYTITGTDANGCVKQVTSTVLVNLLPTIATGPAVTICDRSSRTLTVSGASTYSWSPATGLSSTAGSSVIANPSVTTIYTITGTSGYGCVSTATLPVNVNPLPSVYSVTGGGTFCAGDIGVPVGLTGSQGGINYELFVGSIPYGVTRTGTGAALDFGHPGIAGYYTIKATNLATACSDTMSGGAGIVINHGPVPVAVTGGGGYCPGAPGVHIGLGGSVTGALYQLYRDSVAIDTPVAGTGTSIDFGLHTTTGTYTATAVNAGMGCVSNMTGSATVSVLPAPAQFALTGGGAYCQGGTGVHIGLIGSEIGVRYGLYLSGAPMAPALIGLATPLDFGLFTTPGVYKVIGKNSITGCTDTMSGSATVTINPTPVITGTSLMVRNTTTTLSVTPATGVWSSSKPAVASISSSGVVTGISVGKTTITYTLPTGCYETHDIVVDQHLGIKETDRGNHFAIVPNPSNGTFVLNGAFDNNAVNEAFLEVVNMMGQVVYASKAYVKDGTLNEMIELQNVSAGMYMLSVKAGEVSVILRLVKE